MALARKFHQPPRGAADLRRLTYARRGGYRRASPALLVLALTSSCREQGGTFVTMPDAGEALLTCNTTTDCGGRGICVSGVCEAVTGCTTDDECASEGKVCHSRRFYCVECDGTHAGECPSGQTCQFDFTCVMIGSSPTDAGVSACSGSCTDRAMCARDQVCRGGECCTPPARCTSPQDCPVAQPECNGATGRCFGGDGCNIDADCSAQMGCQAGACFCEIQGAPPGICRVRPDECNSDADCKENGVYVGKFCTLTSPPKRCLNAPSCNTDAECAQSSLICDLTQGSPSRNKCVNGTLCPNRNECNPTTQACISGVCVQKNCINTPSECASNETCDPSSGRCVASSGGPCSQDSNCAADHWCNTSVNQGACQLGCRDNGGCPGGVCNAQHQCEGPSGGICGPCASDTDCPAGTNCIEALGACYEPCSTVAMQACSNPMAQCIFGNCSCFL